MLLNIKISLIKAVKELIDSVQSSYKLQVIIFGSVALIISSPNFCNFKHAWKGNNNSVPLIIILGKSNKCTSKGSNIPFLVAMITLGCSSGGKDLINAATSSAAFHLDNCPNLFCPFHTEVCIIFKNSCPVFGLKIKIAPLTGFVVKFPSKVLCKVTLYTFVSSTNQVVWLPNNSE